MANVKIPQLGSAQSISDNNYLVVDDEMSTLKVTAKQVKKYVIGSDDINHISDVINNAVAPVEKQISEHAYSVGDPVIYNDKLYYAKTSISIGDTITVGTNIEQGETLAKQLKDLSWRNGLRLKNLGSSFTATQQAALAAGDFSEFWNGDYWIINGITWRIVDNTNYQKRRGNTEFTSNHLIIMPDSALIPAEANLIDDLNTSGHGYANCSYRTRTDGKGKAQCKTLFSNAFGVAHIASHKELMSTSRGTGGTTGWGWQDADVELPTESNIYGHGVWGCGLTSSAYSPSYNFGTQWGRFKLFEICPELVINRSFNYWLRDITSASHFALVAADGSALDTTPSTSNISLRPYAVLI